jgi:hypothetical protein
VDEALNREEIAVRLFVISFNTLTGLDFELEQFFFRFGLPVRFTTETSSILETSDL